MLSHPESKLQIPGLVPVEYESGFLSFSLINSHLLRVIHAFWQRPWAPGVLSCKLIPEPGLVAVVLAHFLRFLHRHNQL